MTQRTDAIELAYGLLWTLEIDMTTAEGAQLSKARRNLLVLLDKQGQARGIAAARTAIAADLEKGWMSQKEVREQDAAAFRDVDVRPFDIIADLIGDTSAAGDLVKALNAHGFQIERPAARPLATGGHVAGGDHPLVGERANEQAEMFRKSALALRLLAAEDERQAKLHDLLETVREQIRLGVEPEHRPEGLFTNIQNAVYAMRGRTVLMSSAEVIAALAETKS